MKKFLSLVLAFILFASCMITSSATSQKAELYSVYADKMLFRQNEDAIIAGIASDGNEITAELMLDGNVIAKGKTNAKVLITRQQS